MNDAIMLSDKLKSPITENIDLEPLSNKELIIYKQWLKILLTKYRKIPDSLKGRKKIQATIKRVNKCLT